MIIKSSSIKGKIIPLAWPSNIQVYRQKFNPGEKAVSCNVEWIKINNNLIKNTVPVPVSEEFYLNKNWFLGCNF